MQKIFFLLILYQLANNQKGFSQAINSKDLNGTWFLAVGRDSLKFEFIDSLNLLIYDPVFNNKELCSWKLNKINKDELLEIQPLHKDSLSRVVFLIKKVNPQEIKFQWVETSDGSLPGWQKETRSNTILFRKIEN